MTTTTRLAGQFTEFADNYAAGYSPLYERLARRSAQDPEILKLAELLAVCQPHGAWLEWTDRAQVRP